MGKKMKKVPSPVKAQHRASAGSPKSVLEGSSPNIGSVGHGDRDMEACSHRTQSTVGLNRILFNLRSSSTDDVSCEHCRKEPVSRKGGKEKGKQPKKKGPGKRAADAKSDKSFFWVCLDCGHFFCGGEVSLLEPYGHARRHAKQERHLWAVRADNPLISWCYSCSSSVPIQFPEEVLREENKEGVNDKSSMLKGNALESLDSEKLKGHKVRGLSNLGNTCFFNSVMQNFFAMDLLRDTLWGLDRPVGPLTMALKMLFVETSRSVDSKGAVNPKALFGCICAKAPQFRGYQQQDSHELMRFLLDGLQMEEISARKTSEPDNEEGMINAEKGTTLVGTIFGGRLSSTVSCMECGHTSVVNEPFLDLSLPVPKKSPSKKFQPPPKRANQKDKNKSRRFRERAVAQTSTMILSQKEEIIKQRSECSESEIIVPQKMHDISSEDPDATWMDYLEKESPNCNYDAAHELEASIVQCSFSMQTNEVDCKTQIVSELHNKIEKNAQSISELHNNTESSSQSSYGFHTANCSNNLTVSSYTSVERSSKDEIHHSCVPDPGVMLFPFKKQQLSGLDVNDKTFSQDPDNINPVNVFLSESCTASSILCKQVEEDFDGFGDLFNEPEVTSDLREESGNGEDMEMSLWTSNVSESNLEVVDDTNAPVSIYSCLALFTKPELLSDDQAWYCEGCSEMLLQMNKELGTNKLQVAKISDQPVTVKSMVNEDEFRSKRFASNSHWDSSIANVLDDGKSVCSPKNGTNLVEEHFDQIGIINTSKKPISQAEGSHNGEISSNETSNLAEIASCSNMTRLLDIIDKEMSDSGISQYFSSPLGVNNQAQDGSSNQGSSTHGINDRSNDATDGKEKEVTSHSLQSDSNVLQKYSKEKPHEVSQVRKKGLKSSNVHPTKGNMDEGIKMVKRDATKRILIERVPPILTIHLKRFSQDGLGRLSKLSGHVSFQETLDMRPYLDPRCVKDRSTYRLIGVVEHSGSMAQGHYVAYVRGDGRDSSASTGSGSTGKAWFYASDAHVREVSLAEVLRSEAYILFYEKI